MTETRTRPAPHARIHRGVPELLDAMGYSPEAVDALLRYDIANFRWRRLAEKGDFKGRVVEEMAERLEPAILQGLLSAAQISAGIGAARAQAPTVGMVAERMAVDPSRASRIVSELVDRGFLVREADQEDARRTVLRLTPKAGRFLGEFSAAKWRLMARVFEGWETAEIETFSALLTRYVDTLSGILEAPRDV